MTIENGIVVVSTLNADGEHFFLMPPPDAGELAKAMVTLPQYASGVDAKAWIKERWQRYLESQPALTESGARQALAERGLDGNAVEEKIAKARRGREWAPQTNIEFITRPGYRNPHEQVVVGRTATRDRGSFQRVYVLRCDRCGREHHANGCDIHAAQCPDCHPSFLIPEP